jgi:UDP-glucose 4-epimerase
MDLADGHVAAIDYLAEAGAVGSNSGFGKFSVINLGAGRGYSVLEMIEAMKRASGRPIPYVIGPR